MGRYDLRAQRVLATANLALETKRIPTPPVWHSIVQDIPPPPRLTRPVKSHRQKHKFRPETIVYPEDKLRQEFYSDHPWELARPRVVVENDGNDHKGYDWEFLEQEGKKIDGESVIQRQQHILAHGYNGQRTTRAQAYDLARKEFYTHRHFQDIERRIAREEALHAGAYFGPGPNAIAAKLEDGKFEDWKQWAVARVTKMANARMAGYSGSDEEADADADGEVGGQSLVEQAEAGAEELEAPAVETPGTSQSAVADAVGDSFRR